MKVVVKDLTGKEIEKMDVSPDVFGVKVDDELISQVYIAQYANKRHSKAHTKKRGEVRGSTRKPWKQKGTGRARTGSVKNPLWRSGGIIFGPRSNRNYSRKINKKVARLAVLMVLSGKLNDGELTIVNNYDLKENKTKFMAKAIGSLKLAGKMLVTFSEGSEKYSQATNNLEDVKNVDIKNLNVLDMLNSKHLVLDKEGVKFLEKKYTK
jgi:large subunit ribosomal protein L4